MEREHGQVERRCLDDDCQAGRELNIGWLAGTLLSTEQGAELADVEAVLAPVEDLVEERLHLAPDGEQQVPAVLDLWIE